MEQATGSRDSEMANLEALIRNRNEQRMTDMADVLEAKYGQKQKRPATKEAPAVPKAKKSTKRK